MKFKKYQHVERLGTEATEGILNGTCYIFPKLDGTNTSVYLDALGEIEVASRNRVLSLHEDNAGSWAALHNDERLKKFFTKFPKCRLYGEWLVPHTIRDYEDDAWDKFYIFDVTEADENGEEHYINYEDYLDEMITFKLDFIPCLAKEFNPTVEQAEFWKDKTFFKMKNGKIGEGIVIKNYDFVNKFGNIVWAKSVNKVVKAAQSMHKPLTASDDGSTETLIIRIFLTTELIQKEFEKIRNDNGGWENKLVPRVICTVWHVFIVEELFNALKKFRDPKIDFKLLKKLAVIKIKLVLSDVF